MAERKIMSNYTEKSNNKKLKVVLIVLAILTFVNIVGIVLVEHALSLPRTSVNTEVLGAVFNAESEPNIIDIALVRPPRKAVNPGDVTDESSTITNTSNVPLYFRGTYKIVVEDGEGNVVDGFKSNVKVNVDENWKLRDGYWYYDDIVAADDKIPGMIASIEYSDEFSEHFDYKVYVPIVIESVEAGNSEIEDANCWPDEDIDAVDYKRLNESASWTTNTTIELF